MGENTFYVLALLVTLCCFGAVCTRAQKPSFLSVDCGADEGQVDGLGVEWVTDEGYISTGLNLRVPLTTDPGLEAYITSRYFPDKRNKHCYVLPAVASTTYLVRAVILHGEAAELPLPAKFKVTLNSNSWFTFSLIVGDANLNIALQYEAILYNEEDHIDICLTEAAQGVPWISSLELRGLPSGVYTRAKDSRKMLSMYSRYNLGIETNDIVRWPNDEFDRLWYPATEKDFPNAQRVSSSRAIPASSTDIGFNQPPVAVMRDAFVGTELTYTWNLLEDVKEACFAAYFQDLRNVTATESNPLGIVAIFAGDMYDINITDAGLFQFTYYMLLNESKVNISVIQQPWYDGDVFFNAIEVYSATDINSTFTLQEDVTALKVLQSSLGLTSWTGDPCYPVSYDWVTCDTKNRISALYLSNKNLTGTIPSEIGELTSLTEIYLDNNNINGSIPASLTSLRSLTVLALDNNSLSGSIPTAFQNRVGFTFSGNRDLGSAVSNDLSSDKKTNNTGVIVGVVVGVAVAVVLVIFFIFWWIRRRNPKPTAGKNNPNDGVGGGEPLYHSGQSPLIEQKSKMTPESTGVFHNSTSWPTESSDILTSRGCEVSTKNTVSTKAYAYQVAGYMSMNEVLAATRNHQRKIGEGGYGPVYYGKLANGKEVAVKVNKIGAHQGTEEFVNEVALLTRVHHRNLVSLLAFCEEGDERVLIYEYQHNGTLSDLLYGSNAASRPLAWKARLEIALDAAKGLEYLHTGCSPRIIHRDIKSNNILIDDKMIAKVSDFGISKSTPDQQTITDGQFSTMVRGTPGYLDPEYYMFQKLSQKSDVYSFGVVLMEIISGRRPISVNPDGSQSNIINLMHQCLQTGDIGSIADPALNGEFNPESMWKVAEIAWSSVDREGVRRPDMSKVVRGLMDASDMEMSYDPNNPTMDTSFQLSSQKP